MSADPARDAAIRRIARIELLVETLETRGRDSLDFHDLSVGCIESALRDAYEAGRAAGRGSPKPTRCLCPACGRSIEVHPIT
ncbi:MAG: hypothetical protein U0636_00090 [Phycisphaerales bacterium]